MVKKMIKRNGRCYLLTRCPREGSTDPGSTTSEDVEPKPIPTDFPYNEDHDEDRSFGSRSYQKHTGERVPVDVPLPTADYNKAPDINKAGVYAPEYVIVSDMHEDGIHLPSVTPAEVVLPTPTTSKSSEVLDNPALRLTENLVVDTTSAGVKALNSAQQDIASGIASFETVVSPHGGPGVVYTDNKGRVYEEVNRSKVLGDASSRVTRGFTKANAAAMAVDGINTLWDAYDAGAFENIDKAAEYFTEVVQSIPDDVAQMVTDTVDAVINDNPEVLVDVATAVIGVPSAAKLFDRVATVVTGEEVNVGADFVDALVENAPEHVFPQEIGLGPKGIGEIKDGSKDSWFSWW